MAAHLLQVGRPVDRLALAGLLAGLFEVPPRVHLAVVPVPNLLLRVLYPAFDGVLHPHLCTCTRFGSMNTIWTTVSKRLDSPQRYEISLSIHNFEQVPACIQVVLQGNGSLGCRDNIDIFLLRSPSKQSFNFQIITSQPLNSPNPVSEILCVGHSCG